MPWCPKCGTEYRDGFETCADCEAALSQQPVKSVPQGPAPAWLSGVYGFVAALSATVSFVLVGFFQVALPQPRASWSFGFAILISGIAGLLFAISLERQHRRTPLLVGWLLAFLPEIALAVSLCGKPMEPIWRVTKTLIWLSWLICLVSAGPIGIVLGFGIRDKACRSRTVIFLMLLFGMVIHYKVAFDALQIEPYR